MVSILLRKTGIPKGFSPEEFEREFPLICQSHRDKGRALAFAFILYDFADAQVIKVLDDSVYWDALDRISGSYLTIFSFHITPLGKLGMGLKKRRKVTKQNHLFSYSNSFIEKQFGIELPASQPLLLFFQAGDGKLSTPYLSLIHISEPTRP